MHSIALDCQIQFPQAILVSTNNTISELRTAYHHDEYRLLDSWQRSHLDGHIYCCSNLTLLAPLGYDRSRTPTPCRLRSFELHQNGLLSMGTPYNSCQPLDRVRNQEERSPPRINPRGGTELPLFSFLRLASQPASSSMLRGLACR